MQDGEKADEDFGRGSAWDHGDGTDDGENGTAGRGIFFPDSVDGGDEEGGKERGFGQRKTVVLKSGAGGQGYETGGETKG